MREPDDTTGSRNFPRRDSRSRRRPGSSRAGTRKSHVGRRTSRPVGYRKRAAPAPHRDWDEQKHPLDRESDTDYRKYPNEDALSDGPNPMVAALLSLAISGLGQIYNGRRIRAVLSVAIPLALLLAAVLTESSTMYLMAFVSGVLTAPTVFTLIAVVAGWLSIGHPAFWMGLPLKLFMVGEAALDAYQTRRRHQLPLPDLLHNRVVQIAFASSVGLLLLVWMFTTGTLSVRQAGMNPLLEPGDHVVVDRMAWGLQLPLIGVRIGGKSIQRGEHVAVLDPDGSGRLLIRRVFAVAGDQVDFGPPAGPFKIRQPMLGKGGALATPVLWLPWPGPCVYALEVGRRTKNVHYARCRAYQEHQAGRTFVVSYPRSHDGSKQKKNYRRGKVGRDQVYLLADNRGAVRDSRHWGPVSTRRIRGRPTTVLWSSDPLEGIRWHRMGLRITEMP